MRSHAELVASAPFAGSRSRAWRVSWARAPAPLAFRETPEAVYIVGTAASPVGDDEVRLSVRVEPGARLVVRSAASSIAWASQGSSLEVTVEVADGACLDWQLQPLVATSRCDFFQHSHIELAPGATLRWAEELVLGRNKEGPGRLRVRLDADVEGYPLLRHELAVGPGVPGWDGPAMLGYHRAVGLVLLAGPHLGQSSSGTPAAPAEQAASGTGQAWARMPLEGPAVLVQALGRDLPALREELRKAGGSFTLPTRNVCGTPRVNRPYAHRNS